MERKKLKKKIGAYEVAIILVVLLLVITAGVGIFYFASNLPTKQTQEQPQSGEISEQNARKTAVKKLEELGEKNVKPQELEVMKIQREQQEYYYISSKENTLEIQIGTGKITRINSVKQE